MGDAGVFVGEEIPDIVRHVLQQSAEHARDVPGSVLYLQSRGESTDEIRSYWNSLETTKPLQLRVRDFDDIVDAAYKQETYTGGAAKLRLEARYRLVEHALEQYTESSNPLHTTETPPPSGLVSQTEDLLSLLEFAGELTPEAINDRLLAEGLSDLAPHITAVSRGFHDGRASAGLNEQRLLAERYTTVIEGSALEDELRSVDVVIVGQFTLFTALEAQLLGAITDHAPTRAILPLLNAASDRTLKDEYEQLSGLDRGVERALRIYRELGFERQYIDSDDDPSPAHELAQALYTFTEDDGATPVELDAAGVEWHEYQTPNHEIRGTARAIRTRLADTERSANKIGVVLADPATYQPRLLEAFDAYEIPATTNWQRPLLSTHVGGLVAAATEVATDPDIHAFVELLNNPLLDDNLLSNIDVGRVADFVEQHESQQFETIFDDFEAAPETTAAAVTELEELRDVCTDLAEIPLTDVWPRVETVLGEFGVDSASLETADLAHSDLEQQAYPAVKRACRSIEDTASLLTGSADNLQRLRQSLETGTVESRSPRDDAHVHLLGLTEAIGRSFDEVYIVGLTTAHFPSQQTRLSFARRINEAHPDFEEADQHLEARYALGMLLTQAETVVLSHPTQTADGQPLVEADVLTELSTITDADSTTIESDRFVAPQEQDGQSLSGHHRAALTPGTREDLYRGAARQVATTDTPDATAETLAASPVLTGDTVATRLVDGTECAHARSRGAITDFDGHISGEVLADLYDPATALSPSAIERYAGCGFKFYMETVLGFEEPDEHTLEADARERGHFIHTILERYYQDLQDEPGDAVDPTVDRAADLLDVASAVLQEFEDHGTAFHDGWLRQVFAGLGSEDDNDYYHTPAGLDEDGLLRHFLDNEIAGETTGQPTYLEARVGRPREEDTTILSTTPVTLPGSEIKIKGQVDRVDLIPDTEPQHFVVYDYKTGGGNSIPSTPTTIEGVAFQLPLYTHLIESTVDGVEGIGGEYYQVSPPTSVSKTASIGSSTYANHTYHGPAPLRYHSSSPPFDEHRTDDANEDESYRSFIETTTVERVAEIDAAIRNGAFHPTVLDPRYPGCEHCAFRAVCDVRHHRRHGIADELQHAPTATYVPPLVTDNPSAEEEDNR